MKPITRDAILGTVFFGAIAILTYATVYLTDFSFRERPILQVRFAEAQGLKAGDPVLVLGTRAGRVLSVSFDNETADRDRVLAILQLERPITLRQGFRIQIEESSFLGGRVATIDPGLPASPALGQLTILPGSFAPGPLSELGKFVSENRADVSKIIQGLRNVVDKVEKGEGSLGKLVNDETLYTSVKQTFDNAKEITDSIKNGKGTISRLVNDDTLANNISTTVTNLGDVAKSLKDGKGTLGKLINDETLYNNANEIVADVRAGKGTIGKLIYDQATADDLSASVKNVREITDKMTKGEGSLAKLLQDKELYDNVNGLAGDLRVIVADVREGKGTLGKLVRDETLYNDVQTTFKSINRSIEDAREAAPIGTFAALLFSSF